MRLLLVFLVACSVPAVRPPTVEIDRRVEDEELPPNAFVEPLAENYPGDETDVLPYEPGAGPEWPGIVVSEARAARDGLIRIRYRELRTRYEADRTVWRAHRELYETQLRLAAEQLEGLAPSWWDRRKGTVGAALGVVVGVLGTVLVVWATGE